MIGADWTPLETSLDDHLARIFAQAAANAAGGASAAEIAPAALDWAKSHAATLVAQLDDSTRRMMLDAVAAAIENGDGAEALAARLHASPAFSEDRARLIAATEIRNASSAGALHGFGIAGAWGKSWQVDGDPCPICIANAAAGAIPLGTAFPSGHQAPTAHPDCRCELTAVASPPSGHNPVIAAPA